MKRRGRAKMTDEQKAEAAKRRQDIREKARVYDLNQSMLKHAKNARESLNRIQELADAYELLFAVDWSVYKKNNPGKSEPTILDFLERISENRIASREEHDALEFYLRSLCNNFKLHAAFEKTRADLPSSFVEFLGYMYHKKFKEITSGWESKEQFLFEYSLIIVRWKSNASNEFIAWVKQEQERTSGQVDIRNFPKHDPTGLAKEMIDFLTFPDIVKTQIHLPIGSMTISAFYGLADAIKVMESVAKVNELVEEQPAP